MTNFRLVTVAFVFALFSLFVSGSHATDIIHESQVTECDDDVPQCASVTEGQRVYTITNNCEFAMTLVLSITGGSLAEGEVLGVRWKFEVTAGDTVTKTLSDDQWNETASWTDLQCCPQYEGSQCSSD